MPFLLLLVIFCPAGHSGIVVCKEGRSQPAAIRWLWVSWRKISCLSLIDWSGWLCWSCHGTTWLLWWWRCRVSSLVPNSTSLWTASYKQGVRWLNQLSANLFFLWQLSDWDLRQIPSHILWGYASCALFHYNDTVVSQAQWADGTVLVVVRAWATLVWSEAAVAWLCRGNKQKLLEWGVTHVY